MADNVLRGGQVVEPQTDNDRVTAAFNEHVARDPRVSCVVLTVRDGLTLIRKR